MINPEFQQAVSNLYSFIPKTNMKRFPGIYGIKRVEALLELLGNPQEQIKVIHVAGTSGKGSTSTIISHLLTAHGKKVGLHVKPHLLDVRERFQINNELISEQLFITSLKEVLQHRDSVAKLGYGELTYYEVQISLAYYIFAKENVDYAVVETGLGGLYDGSNVVKRKDKMCILTSIGLDHTEILGSTLKEIATHKAGIIQPGNSVIALKQKEEVNTIFADAAKKQGAVITFIDVASIIHVKKTSEKGTVLDVKISARSIDNVSFSLVGTFQLENVAVSLAAVYLVASQGSFKLDDDIVKKTLEEITFPGRMEIYQIDDKTIILDGAHNPQKISSLIKDITQFYPNKSYSFIVGFKKGKDIETMIQTIVPHAKKIILTNFFNDEADFVSMSEEVDELEKMLQKEQYHNFIVIPDAAKKIDIVLKEIQDDVIVITGSLYLLSDMYKGLLEKGLIKKKQIQQ